MKRIALVVVVLSTAAVGAAYASAFLPGGTPAWAPWSMAIGIAAMMVSIMALGALRDGETARALAFPFAFTFLVLAGGFGLALALPNADTAAMRLWLGLPPRAAVIVYGVGLLPFLVLPYAYARTFERVTLREEDIERIRRMAAEQAPASHLEDAA